MILQKLGIGLLVLIFTIASGVGDSLGFVHSARVWSGSRFVWREALWAFSSWALACVPYWGAIRSLNELAVVSPLVQALVWFIVTMVATAVFSGSLQKWQPVDMAIALVACASVGWLLVRTGG